VEFLLMAAVLSIVGIGVLLVRNRRPTSMESSIDEFARGLEALAPPEERSRRPAKTRRRTGAQRTG
jgi:hypothetical protein